MKKNLLLSLLLVMFFLKIAIGQGVARQTTTVAGSVTHGSADGTGSIARFYSPVGIAVNPTTGNLFVADAMNYLIRKVTPQDIVTTVAGKAGVYGYLDGQDTAALFEHTG